MWPLILFVCVLVLTAACGDGRSGTPPEVPFPALRQAHGIRPPWITVRNGHFVDRRGRRVVLHGVDVGIAPASVYAQALRLRVNLVRVVAPWSLFEPAAPHDGRHTWSGPALAALDVEVRFFEAHRVNVLIDFHQFHWSPYFAALFPCRSSTCTPRGVPAWFYSNGRFSASKAGIHAAEAAFWTTEQRSSQAAYAAFAAMMARHFSRFPNVIGYEIFNEPQSGQLGQSASATNDMLRWQAVIRHSLQVVDPTRTVFVMCHGGSEGIGTANLGLLGPPDHLALDWHDYFNGRSGGGLSRTGDVWVPSWARTHNQATTSYTGTIANQRRVLEVPLRTARRWHVALLIGEWGIDVDADGARTYQSQMLELFRRFGLSNTRWELTAPGGLGLVTQAGRMNLLGAQLVSWYGRSSSASG